VFLDFQCIAVAKADFSASSAQRLIQQRLQHARQKKWGNSNNLASYRELGAT
jgi:hypothetical protein